MTFFLIIQFLKLFKKKFTTFLKSPLLIFFFFKLSKQMNELICTWNWNTPTKLASSNIVLIKVKVEIADYLP